MRIVCDTGPLLHLRKAGALPLLGRAGQVHIPPAVQSELLAHDPRSAAERPAWDDIVLPVPASVTEAVSWLRARLLDAGEAEALASQLKADWFLTDDTAARDRSGRAGARPRRFEARSRVKAGRVPADRPQAVVNLGPNQAHQLS
jgi:predicted nucleic acid-binding protein